MQRTYDTVEEFWDKDHIQISSEQANSNSIENFRNCFGNFVGVSSSQIGFSPSGRKALELLLKSISSSKHKVLLPAFTCSVVQDAVINAGFIPCHYDLSDPSGIFDWNKIKSLFDSETGVILITHYYGVPIDFEEIIEECRNREIVIIEDCAHTLGGKVRDKMVGTLGDASIFSFNYDKPISLGWGGVSIINNYKYFQFTETHQFRTPAITEEFNLIKDFLVAMDYRRVMIPFVERPNSELPGSITALDKKIFTPKKGVSIGTIQAELGIWSLNKYEQVLKIRNKFAKNLILKSNLDGWWTGSNITPAWLKQRIRFDCVKSLESTAKEAQNKGFRIGNFNWPILLAGVDHRKFKNSLNSSTLWLDVPIHQNLDNAKITEMISILRN